MLRISKLADYSILIMKALADAPVQLMSAHELKQKTRLNLPTVSKLLKLLLEAGMVVSQRGPTGGYRINGVADEISVAMIVSAIDGPIAMTECSLTHNTCEHASQCETKENWQIVSRVIEEALGSVSLTAMCGSLINHPLMLKGVKVTSIVKGESH